MEEHRPQLGTRARKLSKRFFASTGSCYLRVSKNINGIKSKIAQYELERVFRDISVLLVASMDPGERDRRFQKQQLKELAWSKAVKARRLQAEKNRQSKARKVLPFYAGFVAKRATKTLDFTPASTC